MSPTPTSPSVRPAGATRSHTHRPPADGDGPRMHLRDVYPRWPVEVVAVADPAPRVRRLTLRAPEFAGFTRLGADEYVGLLMPRAGTPLVMPEGADARRAVAALPEDVRPGLRWYTVRAHRPPGHEIDVDIVVHDEGPGGEFLARVAPGDRAGIVIGTGGYTAPTAPEDQVLVADETAYPALSAMAEEVAARLGSTDRIHAFVEAPTPDHLARAEMPFPVTYAWRGDAAPGSAILPRMAAPAGPRTAYAWSCGEASLATGGRRRLVELGVAKSAIFFSGYWRRGQPRP